MIIIIIINSYDANLNNIGYYYVNLVRCREFPDIEGEYVVEICHSHSSYKVWPVDRSKRGWEWKFSDIIHCNWHLNATKMEVECKRYSNDTSLISMYSGTSE